MVKQRSDERGFALLIVLWSVGLLALLGTRIAANGRLEAQLASNIRTAAELEAAADAGLHEAVFRLLDRSGQRWRADGAWHQVRLPRGDVDVLLESLDGKPNPSLVSADLLSALFRQVGVQHADAAQLAARVQEWRDPGRWPRNMQAKAGEYRAAGRDYGPPGAPFRSLDELRLVLGMTPDTFAKVQPHLSVYALGDPDPDVADPVVLGAMTAAGPNGHGSFGHAQDHAVAVTSVAAAGGGERFVRRAVVAVGGEGSQPWRILALEDDR